ncbi:MAG: Hsp20/alpha crystallin family protein [Arenicellales bacterium]
MSKKLEKSKKDVPVKVESSGAFQELEKRMREMETRFEDFFTADWMHPSKWELPDWAQMGQLELKVPKMDIVDRDDDVLVRADLPGVTKDDIDVSLTDNTITVKGSTSEEKKEEKGDYYRSETMKGTFSRTMSLPSDVDGSKANSTFKDGVLEVVVPKLEKARRHSVKVS